MNIYNTLTKRVENVVPLEAYRIKMYSCGPTVYRSIHIGNLRTFTMADWLRRAFIYRGYGVLHVKNITDVGHMRLERVDRGEDKVIAQARKEGKTSQQIAQFYTEAFHQDEAALNILPAHVFPRATEHVPEMIEIIQGLLEKGIAYEVNGYVYYDVQCFASYGKLSGNQLAGMLAGLRDEVDSGRRHPEDFPLWKLAEPGREMAWDSPWGRGFPGWHIECSAMSMKYLGSHFDLHTGGVDNIFPHHEDEVAQSEGFSGQHFVNYWVHAQHLLADGQKMAKSMGNAYTRAEIEARGFDALALRYFYTTALYRSRLNFTFRALQAAQTSLERLRTTAYALFLRSDQQCALCTEELCAHPCRDAFLAAVEDDLHMPRALSVVWAMLRSPAYDATTRVRLLLDFDRILGFDLRRYLHSDEPRKQHNPQVSLAAVPAHIGANVRERDSLRQHGDYAQADTARRAIHAVGYELRDTRQGTLVLPHAHDDAFVVLSSSRDAPDHTRQPDLFEFSVNLLAHNSRADLERCLHSLCRSVGHHSVELVLLDNGSTDDTLPYLEHLARQGDLIAEQGQRIGLHVLFADHTMGFAAGRNATMRASQGRTLVLLDTSLEVKGDLWEPLALTLADPHVGLVGPYGLVTDDLREFSASAGPDVDAVEGYLMAFRRELLSEVGWIDERFRFYRLMDIYFSFFFKAAGYRVLTTPQVAERVVQHPHREWTSLSEEERASKSKKNYDIFRKRWHHGQSLLVAHYDPENLWQGHDHAHHLEGTHSHSAEELPPAGTLHSHMHRHWPDHSHEHPHAHDLIDR